jgi:hypothetical protein
MTSLVQRRMAIDRRRKAAVAYLAIGAAWLIFGAIGWAVAPESSTHWWNLGLAIAWLASGSLELWRYRRQMAAFVEENRVAAGRR